MSITVPLTGFGTKRVERYNYLDNSDFTQFVAQAGIGGTHGAQAYAGDRWILDSGKVTGEANDNGNGYFNITLNGTIRQIIANPPSEGSVFVEMVSGEATAAYQNGEVTITSNGGVIKNVLLCKGVVAVAPKSQPKGYGAELAECQRYSLPVKSGTYYAAGCVNSAGTTVICAIPVPVQMRTVPSLSSELTAKANWFIYADGSAKTPDAVSIFSHSPGFVNLNFTTSGMKRQAYFVGLTENGYLSCDL